MAEAMIQPGSEQREPKAGPRALRGEAHEAVADTRPAAIEVRGVSKCYQIYKHPSDRLKQALTRWKKKYYREFWAVRDVSLTVRKGESVGIIGRNGSGKSTLMQMIAGTLNPTEGSVRVNGQISALLELGAGFNAEFTGRENVFLAGSIRGLSRKRVNELYDRIVEFADIGDFIDQPVKTYSSGMYVRLAFAVAAQVRPEILVVDEALAVGDVFFQQRCHKYMREDLADTTKLLVTHDLNAVANHCDRALVMHKGRVAFEGEPLDAIAFYTKIVHNAQFGGDKAPGGAAKGRPQGEVQGANSGDASGALDESLPWVEVTADKLGGAGDVVIRRVALADSNGEPVRAIQPRDSFTCYFEIDVATPRQDLIFGVVMNDRFGNAVFGDNSLSKPRADLSCPEAGSYVVRMDYVWPEVRPAEYTATFGIGEGKHAHHHTVQCWAHNVVSVTGIAPQRPVHGMFTNPVKDVRITRVG
ncbi:MAG: ABC transporter ATP-binding protein [Phycisphaerales bacterium JB054]